MVIDGFTVIGGWPGLPDDHPVEQLIEGLDRYKLNYACAVSANSIFLDARGGNQATLAACRQDKRLIPIGVADPRVNGAEQVEACVQQGVRLMALFPASQGWSFSTLLAKSTLQRLAAANLPVFIEVAGEGAASEILRVTSDYPMPVILLDVNLYTLAEAVSVMIARPQTYITTRLLCGGDTIEYLAQRVGAEHIVFSSRYPVSCFSAAFLTAKFASLSNDDRNAVMGGNLAGLLGRPA